jgi:sugar lactone lactonase YvrE
MKAHGFLPVLVLALASACSGKQLMVSHVPVTTLPSALTSGSSTVTARPSAATGGSSNVTILPSAATAGSSTVVTPTGSGVTVAVTAGTVAIAGIVRSPARLLSNNGGSLLSDYGALVIANNGAGLVTDNGSGVISNNGGGVVSGSRPVGYNGSGFHVLSRILETDLVPVARAVAVLVDPFGRPVSGVAPVHTDATGAFSFPNAPMNSNWIVEVRPPGFQLSCLVQSGAAGVQVTPATTIVTEHLRTALDDQKSAMRVVPALTFQQLTADIEKALALGDLRIDLSSQVQAAGVFDQVAAREPALGIRSRTAIHEAHDAAAVAIAAGKLDAVEPSNEPSTAPSIALDPATAAGRFATYIKDRKIGAPWDIGAGAGPHLWHGSIVQRFYGDRSETEAHCMVVDGPMGPHLLRNEFYNTYVSTGLYWSLGAPLEDDVVLQEPQTLNGVTYTGPSVRQRFERGYFLWTEGSNVVTHFPNVQPTLRPALEEVRYPPNGVTAVDVSTFSGTGEPGLVLGRSDEARYNEPWGIATGPDGSLYVSDRNNGLIRKLDRSGRALAVVGPDGQPIKLDHPAGLVVDAKGTLYVAEAHQITRIAPGKAPVVFAGAAGNPGVTDGLGSAARFQSPLGLTLGKDGTLYVADTGNHRIRAIDTAGNVKTLAGGSSGFTDGQGGAASFQSPAGLAVDGTGTVYVADTGNHAIRQVSSSGAVLTLTGVSGTAGRVDGSGMPTYKFRPPAAQFSRPLGVALNPDGDLYITEADGNAIRKITFGTATSFTLAGASHEAGFVEGDGRTARFNQPNGVAVDRDGQIWISDTLNHRIRKVLPVIKYQAP